MGNVRKHFTVLKDQESHSLTELEAGRIWNILQLLYDLTETPCHYNSVLY